MKDLFKCLVVAVTCFSWSVWNSAPAFGGDFASTSTASKLSIYNNNGKPLKTFTKTGTDRSLSGTGLSGTVADGGDHWILHVTGGMLYGYITTSTGLEINLAGTQIGIACTRSVNAIKANGGVRICGPGMLHIDQMATYAAIYGGSGNVAITLGAVVGVNGVGVTSAAVSGTGIRILASALHVNSSGGQGLYCEKNGISIGESIVSVYASKAALYQKGSTGQISIAGSCVHLISGNASAIQCGNDISSAAQTMNVANSVFCALGDGHGIQGTLFGRGTSMVFDNVVGVIAGTDCGIYSAGEIFIGGGSTKLSIAGNIDGHHTSGDATAVDYLESNSSSGQGIRAQTPARAYFGLEAGNVKLYSPGVCALDCGTNAVTGGKLEIPAKATYGDFQTLFTWQGAISAAEIFMGRSLFQSDLIYGDFDIAQAFSGVLPASAALFLLSDAKTHTGVSADMFYVTGGEVSVVASGVGIHLGGCYASKGAYLTQKGGRISVEAGRIAIADDDAVDGYASGQADDSAIWLTGGKLTARGGWDGILTCGYVLQEGGTLDAAATGGYSAGTISSKPGLRGYALSANKGFAIEGGSFVATAGTLRTTPNTSSAHGHARVYPCDLSVSGTSAVSVSGMVPSWYGVNSLYPVGGKVRFWLPLGSAALKYGGAQYTANGTGKVVAGSNVFRTGSSSTATLALGASSRSFTAAAANSKELKVTANVKWTAKSTASWLALKTASGSGNGNIVYNLAANTGTSSRTGKIMVTGGGISRTFTVTQSGKSGGGSSSGTSATLALGASSRSFTAAAANSKELKVTAKVSWTAKSGVSWLKLKKESGSGNGTIVYDVAANTGTSSRTGKITVTGGGISRTFTVMQSGKGGGGSNSGTSTTLALGATSRSFTAAAANSKELKVTAKVSWTAKSGVSWLKVKKGSGSGNGTIVYDVAANTGTSSRTGKITVAGGGISRTFTVTQSGKGCGGSNSGTSTTLALGASSRSFTAAAANSKELKVTANVKWTAKSSVSWLALKTASGSGNGNIVYNVAANTGTSSRTGKITVTGGGISRTFTVTQQGTVSWKYTVSNGKATVTGAVPAVGHLAIPATLGGCPVTDIKQDAFWECTGLTSVTIPSSVTSIGARAFGYCKGLKSISIPRGVKSIAAWAFIHCNALTNITIPDSVTSIGRGAFSSCPSLRAISVALGNPAYKSVSGLLLSKDGTRLVSGVNGQVVIPNGVRSINDHAFWGCSGLTSVTIPVGVTNIDYGAFAYCDGLTSVTIPHGVTCIGATTFHACSKLKSVTIPGSVTEIYSAFNSCGSLTTFSVDNSNPCYKSVSGLLLSKDGTRLIRGVNGKIVIPDGVRSINDNAFCGYSGLTSVSIPASVTNIGSGTFGECSLLTSFSVASGNPAYKSVSGLLLSKDGTTLVSGINGNVVIPVGVTTIGDGAFFGCGGLTTITIPNSVRSIGKSAFESCIGLVSVSVPDGVKSIGEWAFAVCTGLASIQLPASLESIGDTAFCYCSGLVSLTIPSSVTSIGVDAFDSCNHLGTLCVPASWKGTDMLANAGVPNGCQVVYSGASRAKRSRLAMGGHVQVWVTTSDGHEGNAVIDGDEETGWGSVEEEGGWVVLSYSEVVDVKGVEVKGEGLPEDGVRVLLSEDADDWREETEGLAQYVWVIVPEGTNNAKVTEIVVEE